MQSNKIMNLLLSIIAVLVCITITILSLFTYISMIDTDDKDHTVTNVTYYGIHKLECPVCNATGLILRLLTMILLRIGRISKKIL
jgi:hypothetical protein